MGSLILARACAAACALSVALGTAVPVTAGGVYFVKQGDTLQSVSRLFGATLGSIRDLNPGLTDAIKPGDKIRIPDRAAAPARPVPESRILAAADTRIVQAICREETVYHTVSQGDTLFAIARQYGTGVDDLLRLNGLRKRARLSIGQKLLVRRTGPRTHTVARGETLYRIAQRHGLSVAELERLNSLDGAAIAVGQRLLVEPCDPYAAAGAAPPPLSQAQDQTAAAAALLAPAQQPLPAEDAAAVSVAERVISVARTMLDIPYRFGGTTLRGIDCSGYVQRVFKLADLELPRTAREQYGLGERVAREELAVGDLVFFRTYASFPSHVGIYLGDNLFIHASSMVRKVTIDHLDMPYYRQRFLGARRVVGDAAPALAAAP